MSAASIKKHSEDESEDLSTLGIIAQTRDISGDMNRQSIISSASIFNNGPSFLSHRGLMSLIEAHSWYY